MDKFPFLHQLDSNDCGPACIRMICKYYKNEYSAGTVKAMCNLTRVGATLLDINSCLKQMGFETALLKLTRGMSAQKEVREVPIGKLFSFDTVRGVWKQKGGEERMLTAREADLLRMLCEHKGQIVRREVILSRLWNTEEDYFASRSLDVFVSRLRKLLAADDTVELKTVKGVGLMLEEKV